MLPASEDNSDELFRNAADDYRLKAENPHWNKLLGKLNKPAEKNSKRKAFALAIAGWLHHAGSFLFRQCRWTVFGRNTDRAKKKINLPGCVPAVWVIIIIKAAQ